MWKAINQLKEAGYEIEAQQNKGYKLMAAPDLMTEAEIKSLMQDVYKRQEVDGKNLCSKCKGEGT